MPILDVQLIGPVPDEIRTGLARRIADAASGILGSGIGETWVTLHIIPEDCYAENAGGPPPGVRPVLVSILKADPPHDAALADEVARLTQAVARACGRPAENVHVIYAPGARGRVAFGGRPIT